MLISMCLKMPTLSIPSSCMRTHLKPFFLTPAASGKQAPCTVPDAPPGRRRDNLRHKTCVARHDTQSLHLNNPLHSPPIKRKGLSVAKTHC